MRNEMTIEMARPAADIFPYIEDTEKLSLWLSGLVAATNTDVKSGEVTGSFRQLLMFGGRMLRFEGRLAAFEADRHLAYDIKSKVGDIRIDYRLEDSPRGTRLHYSCETDLQGVRRLASPILRWVLQRKINTDLNRLKEVVEGAP